ncbi:hypothetical protein D3C73_546010 [compost metagenome]
MINTSIRQQGPSTQVLFLLAMSVLEVNIMKPMRAIRNATLICCSMEIIYLTRRSKLAIMLVQVP